MAHDVDDNLDSFNAKIQAEFDGDFGERHVPTAAELLWLEKEIDELKAYAGFWGLPEVERSLTYAGDHLRDDYAERFPPRHQP